MSILIDFDRCGGCGSCVAVCAEGALSLVKERAFVNAVQCSDCGRCIESCDNGAIRWAQVPSRTPSVPIPWPVDEQRIHRPALLSQAPAREGASVGEWLGLLGRWLVNKATDALDKSGSSRTMREPGSRCRRAGTLHRMRRRGR